MKRKFSKYKERKTWKILFRPKCFGDREELHKCILKYYQKSTVDKRVLPCKHYYDCLKFTSRKEIEKYK